jgi:hypothetical protein
MALAATATAFLVPAAEAAAAVAVAPQAAVKAEPAHERGCDSCGVVQTIRRTDPATGLASYAFSVRMRDGSTRDSTEATRGRWVEGDRVMLIGGAAARALEEKNAAL